MIETLGDVGIMGMRMIEMALEEGVEEYEESGDFEAFKTPLTASLTPIRFKILKIACEELTNGKEDYHSVMSFIEKIEEISYAKVDEVVNEFGDD